MRAAKVVIVSLAIIAGTLVLAWELMVPRAIERELRHRLDEAGFAHARFEVGNVALDRVELLEVSLAPGLDLGDVSIVAGPYQLWRGREPDVVLHGARMNVAALAAGHGRDLPLGRVTIEDGELVKGDEPIAVRGSIDLRRSVAAFDLVALAPSIRLGSVVVADAAATIRGPSNDLHVCATGHVDATQVDACIDLDARTAETANIVWAAHDRDWSAKGGGRLVRSHESVALEAGIIEIAVRERASNGYALVGGTLHAQVEGDLATRSFSVRGELTAERIANKTVTLSHASIPFEVTGRVGDVVELRSERELELTATSALVAVAGNQLRVEAPVVVARGSTRLGNRLDLTSGERGDVLTLVTTLRGVSLDRVLASATRERVRATGLLDGELVFELDDDTLDLVGGSLASRAPGRLLTNDARSLAAKVVDNKFDIHHRIAAALADFDYARLTLTVARDPDLHLSLRGRGRRVPQELHIDVNLRGLLARNERTP